MRKYTISVILVLLAAVSLFAETITRTQTLNLNSNLAFKPNSIKSITCTRNDFAGFVYPCTGEEGSFDLFVAVEFDLYTCSYTCQNLAIGSPRPFYVSRKPFGPGNAFDLDDTVCFTRCDTVRLDMHIPGHSDGYAGCFMPHLGTPNSETSPLDSGCFLILQTEERRYAIAFLEPVISQGWDLTYAYKYISGFKVRWYLQQDGTLNFQGVTGVLPQIPHPAPAGMDPKSAPQGMYNIRGQKITGDCSFSGKAAGVVLIKNGNGVERSFKVGGR